MNKKVQPINLNEILNKPMTRRQFLEQALKLAGASLVLVACGGRLPGEQATVTPKPTDLPKPTNTPEPTSTPEATAIPTLKERILAGDPELIEPMTVEAQKAKGLTTDLAGTRLAVQEGIGSTGIMLLDAYNQIKGVVDETETYSAYAEDFQPELMTDPDGKTRFDATKVPEKLRANYDQAPGIFNRGRKAWSVELGRIAYVDENGSYTGVVNCENSFLADEEGNWYNGPIKATGWGNVLCVMGKLPQYNQMIMTLRDGAVDPDGGERLADAYLALVCSLYELQNGRSLPDGLMEEFQFTRGEGRLLVQPGRSIRFDKYKHYGDYYEFDEGQVEVNQVDISKAFVLMRAKKVVNTGVFEGSPALIRANKEMLQVVDRYVYTKLRGENKQLEPLSGFFMSLGNVTHDLFFDAQRNDLFVQNQNRFYMALIGRVFYYPSNEMKVASFNVA